MHNSEDSRLYLEPKADGLTCRTSQPYALDKLRLVQTYLNMAGTAMSKKKWRERYYIDLMAGPGKNDIRGKIHLGSPLLALNASTRFTQYRFNELNDENFAALKTRISASPLKHLVELYQQDANIVVEQICTEIAERDRPYLEDEWPCFNVCFLDPEGLEINWETVKRLAEMKRMDMIMLFSTSGLLRALGNDLFDSVDDFFGTKDWRAHYKRSDSSAVRRRKLIDFYLSRFGPLGYKVLEHESREYEVVFKNSKNVQVYSIIFASKHDRGYDFWKKALNELSQPRLL